MMALERREEAPVGAGIGLVRAVYEQGSRYDSMLIDVNEGGISPQF